ncbi:MAG: hypothetical protein AMXMBFR72_34370 [Betaproteobacteria bacterium]
MNADFSTTVIALLLGAAAVSSPASAGLFDKDRPGTPADVKVSPAGPTAVNLSFTNTAARDELVKFEVEQTTNGVRLAHSAEAGLSSRLGWSGTGDAWGQFHGMVVRDLTPQTEYCFRVWSRVVSSGVRSDQPSAWACTVTPPHPPLAPLDVQARLAGIGDKTPRISWNTPDQSGWRPIDRYVIERQSPPGPNRPWLLDKSVAGPAGVQDVSTRLAFAVEAAPIDTADKHLYRVCAENAGGRTCAKPIAVTATIHQQIERDAVAPPKAAAAAPLPARREARTPAHEAPVTAATARPRVPPAAAAASAQRPQPAGAVTLNPQPLPPNSSAAAARSQQENGVAPNPQPSPKWTVPAATATPPTVRTAPSVTGSALQSRTQPAAGSSPSQAPASALGR